MGVIGNGHVFGSNWMGVFRCFCGPDFASRQSPAVNAIESPTNDAGSSFKLNDNCDRPWAESSNGVLYGATPIGTWRFTLYPSADDDERGEKSGNSTADQPEQKVFGTEVLHTVIDKIQKNVAAGTIEDVRLLAEAVQRLQRTHRDSLNEGSAIDILARGHPDDNVREEAKNALKNIATDYYNTMTMLLSGKCATTTDEDLLWKRLEDALGRKAEDRNIPDIEESIALLIGLARCASDPTPIMERLSQHPNPFVRDTFFEIFLEFLGDGSQLPQMWESQLFLIVREINNYEYDEATAFDALVELSSFAKWGIGEAQIMLRNFSTNHSSKYIRSAARELIDLNDDIKSTDTDDSDSG